MIRPDLYIILSIPFQLFFCIYHSSPAVNPEAILNTTFTSAITASDAVFNVGIWTNIPVIRHNTKHSKLEISSRQTRNTNSILKIKELRSFVVLVSYHDNHSRHRWQRRQTVVADCHLATITMVTSITFLQVKWKLQDHLELISQISLHMYTPVTCHTLLRIAIMDVYSQGSNLHGYNPKK